MKEKKGITRTLPTDMDNVFVVLTALTLTKELYTISRTFDN